MNKTHLNSYYIEDLLSNYMPNDNSFSTSAFRRMQNKNDKQNETRQLQQNRNRNNEKNCVKKSPEKPVDIHVCVCVFYFAQPVQVSVRQQAQDFLLDFFFAKCIQSTTADLFFYTKHLRLKQL